MTISKSPVIKVVTSSTDSFTGKFQLPCRNHLMNVRKIKSNNLLHGVDICNCRLIMSKKIINNILGSSY